MLTTATRSPVSPYPMQAPREISEDPPAQGQTHSLFLKTIPIAENQRLYVEPGAMLAFKNATVEVIRPDSLYSTVKKYIWGGESIFLSVFTGQPKGGWISLEEQYEGQIVAFKLKPYSDGLTVCNGAFIAATSNVDLVTRYEGLQGWFAGKGFGTMRAAINDDQEGTVYLSTSVGQIKAVHVQPGESVIIDNTHLIAYTPTLNTTIEKIGGLQSTILSGEGLVTKFTGSGVVLMGSGESTGRSGILATIGSRLKKMLADDLIPNAIVGGVLLAGYHYMGINKK